MPGPIRRDGTRPLPLPADLAGPAKAPLTQPKGDLSPRAGVSVPNRVRASLEAEHLKNINLNDLDIPEPPEAEEKEESGGFWGKIGGAITNVVESVVDVAQAGVSAAGDAIEEVKESLGEGQSLGAALKDGARAGGQTLLQEGLDPLLDRSVLGADDQANDRGVGALGPLLTNRLSVGESVDFTVEAGVTLPTELVGAPNIKLDQAGTLRVKRVPALDANDQPMVDPATGEPETRLEVELIVEGKVGAAYAAKVGFSATTQVGQFNAGIEAEAEAEAEAGLTGSVSIKLHLDPDNPDQMGSLTAMMKTVASNSAVAKVPGLRGVFANMSESQRAEAMAASSTYIESISGTGGLYAAASARATLEAGLTAAEREASGTSIKSKAKDWLSEKATETIADELNFSVAGASISAGANFEVGQERNYRTGERTLSVAAGGGVSVNASLLAAGGKVGASANRQLDFVFSETGELTDINIQQSFTKEEFLALQSTLEDFYGRPFDPGFIMKLESSDTVTVEFSVRPEVLADLKQKMGSGSPQAIAQAAKTILTAAISKDDVLVEQGDVTAVRRQEFSVEFNVNAAFFGEIGVRGAATLGHQQESKV